MARANTKLCIRLSSTIILYLWKELVNNIYVIDEYRTLNVYLGQELFTCMGNFEKMLTGRDPKKEWKKQHKPEEKKYNKNYYATNKKQIKAQRQNRRIANKSAMNFGFG